MTAQRGKDLLIKLDQAGSGSYETIAGLRAKRIAFNAETVDITHAESAGRWRELLAGSGVQRARHPIPAAWRKLIDRAMAPNPADRFADARAFKEALQDAGLVAGAAEDRDSAGAAG